VDACARDGARVCQHSKLASRFDKVAELRDGFKIHMRRGKLERQPSADKEKHKVE
jgi:hypothetical protein